MNNGPDDTRTSRRHDPALYRRRVLLAILASQALILLLIQLPVYDVPLRVGWYPANDKPAALEMIEAHEVGDAYSNRSEAPPTRFDELHDVSDVAVADSPTDEPGAAREAPPPAERIRGLALHDAAPYIEGGLGAFYIHIEYPEEAIRANIQGRLLISFTLTEQGRATDIEIDRPLHPLCDSAAVRALRATHFIRPRRDGEPVSLRMRLPVVFRLVQPAADLTATVDQDPG